jgi:Replication-relaxation
MPPELALPKLSAEILDCLYQHRLLSTPQLREVATPQHTERSVVRLLDELLERQLIDCVRARNTQGRGHRLWLVTPLGAELVEAVPDRAEMRRRLLTPALASGQVQAHTLAVNDACIAFLRAARERSHDFGPYSWRHEVAHEVRPAAGRDGRRRSLLIVDAVLRYWMSMPGGRTAVRYRFLELDRANRLVDDVVAKLVRYQQLRELWSNDQGSGHPASYESPAWPLLYRHFPGVLVVLANAERTNLQRRLTSMLALSRAELGRDGTNAISVSFCFFVELMTKGPFAPIFRRLEDDLLVNWLGVRDSDARLASTD